MMDLVDVTATGKLIAEIDGQHFLLTRWERGVWRAVMVDRGVYGGWSPCDDDDFIIRDGVILWREVGWRLEKKPYEREAKNG